MRVEVPKGTYKLVWSLAPSAEQPTPLMCSKFFDRNNLDRVLRAANLLSGDWYLFQLAHHNPPPNNNLYWALLPYGSYEKMASVFAPIKKAEKAEEVFLQLAESKEEENSEHKDLGQSFQ